MSNSKSVQHGKIHLFGGIIYRSVLQCLKAKIMVTSLRVANIYRYHSSSQTSIKYPDFKKAYKVSNILIVAFGMQLNLNILLYREYNQFYWNREDSYGTKNFIQGNWTGKQEPRFKFLEAFGQRWNLQQFLYLSKPHFISPVMKRTEPFIYKVPLIVLSQNSLSITTHFKNIKH